MTRSVGRRGPPLRRMTNTDLLRQPAFAETTTKPEPRENDDQPPRGGEDTAQGSPKKGRDELKALDLVIDPPLFRDAVTDGGIYAGTIQPDPITGTPVFIGATPCPDGLTVNHAGRLIPRDRGRTAKAHESKNKTIPAKKLDALNELARALWGKHPSIRGNINRTATDLAEDMLNKLRAIDPKRYPPAVSDDKDDKKAKQKAARWIRAALSKTDNENDSDLPL